MAKDAIKKYNKTMVKKILSLLFILTVLVGATGCGKEDETVKFSSVDDLNGYSIGVITGGMTGIYIPDMFPDSQILEYATISDCVAALKQGKIDGTPYDLGMVRDVCKQNEELTYFNETLISVEYGSVFAKNEEGLEKCEDFNAFLEEMEESGELSRLKEKWIDTGSEEVFDYESLPEINGKYVLATDGLAYPMSFSCNGKLTGLEIELIYRYCLDRGYALEIMQCDFSGILASVSSEKADIGASSIICTEERKESLYFSSAYYSSTQHMIVRKENMLNAYNCLSDLEGKTLADITGSVAGPMAEATFEEITIDYYESTSDLVEAVLSGKAEGAVISASTYSNELSKRDDLRILDTIGDEECAYFFPKTEDGETLKLQFNTFIKESKKDGTIEKLDEKWADETADKHLDFDSLNGENGTLKYACSSTVGEPACYVYDNEITGKEVEFVFEFARAYGYDLEITDYSFNGMLQAIGSNMADIGGSNTAITEERAETVDFSDPFYSNPLYIVIKNNTEAEDETGFFESIRESFEKTFIKEDRYRLFIEGISATCEITFFSILFGLILGVFFYALDLLKNRIVSGILKLLSNLLSDMPTVVLLMVFYYLIFSNSSLDGLAVSIVAFSILFGSTVLNILKTSFASVDKGQYEAALALGYSKPEAIWKIIVPEILPMFFTLFISDTVSLVKATSIVGYIAVQDLTKVSDIVRSRTYEPFFPLIVTALLYILIIMLFKKMILAAADFFNTKKSGKSAILKGVDRHD